MAGGSSDHTVGLRADGAATGTQYPDAVAGSVPIAPARRLSIRRVVRTFGHLLLVLGVLLLVWSFVIWKWSDPFTALYTHYEQGKLAHQYVKRERKVVASLPKIAPTVPVAAEEHAVAREAAKYRAASTTGEAIGRIVVPRLGLNMILVNGTDEASLMRGPGRDARTYMPGQGQLVYVAGHRTTYLAPFSHIDSMRNGDLITVRVPYGNFVYRVYAHVIVPATDVSRLLSHGREVIALQACHPRFFATHRYIVYGKLVHVIPARGKPYNPTA